MSNILNDNEWEMFKCSLGNKLVRHKVMLVESKNNGKYPGQFTRIQQLKVKVQINFEDLSRLYRWVGGQRRI